MKTVVISGAGKGIGFELCHTFLRNRFHVIALSRSIEALQELSIEHPNLSIYQTDITNQESIKRFADTLNNTNIDILINNAGVLINKRFDELSINDWESHWQVNVLGAVRLIKTLKRYMEQGSNIVNISSMGGFQGSSKYSGLSAYSTTKGALAILSECLAAEFQADKITVNALCLGAVNTEMLQEAFPGYQTEVSSTAMADFIFNFATQVSKQMNGKIIPISKSNP